MTRGRGLRAGAASIAALLVGLGARAGAAAEPLAWTSPAEARTLAWPAAPEARARDVSPDGDVTVPAGEVLFVPVDAGDAIEVRGDAAAIGLGVGAGATPDAVAWGLGAASPGAPRRVHVPSWSSARFLAVRAREGAPSVVRVVVAAREVAPMDWYRADEAIARWLAGPASAPPPRPPIAEAEALVRWLAAARQAIAGAPEEAARGWLMARWLEGSLAVRPTEEPYFARPRPSVRGGRPVADLPEVDGATAWVAARAPAPEPGKAAAPARITIDAAGADVARLTLRAPAVASARVVIRAGGAIVREVRFAVPPWLERASGWTPPTVVRVALPVDARTITIDVDEGEVAVAAAGYRPRTGALGWLAGPTRDRAHEIARAAAATAPGPSGKDAADAFAALVAADRRPDEAASRAAIAWARREDLSPGLRAITMSESVRWAATADEARSRAMEAWAAASRLPPAVRGPIARAALDRLAATRPAPTHAPRPPASDLAGAHDDDRAAAEAILATLGAPVAVARPEVAPAAERFARAHPDLDAATRRAREAWARESSWAALAPPIGAPAVLDPVAPSPPPGAGGRCPVRGPHGLRWTWLPAGRTPVDVAAPLGTHARVLVRSAAEEPRAEAPLGVDGASVAVHEGAGLVSVVAVAPGARTFDRPAGAAPLIARIPREGEVACEALRDLEAWVDPRGGARFALPGVGETVARVVVRPRRARPGTPAVGAPGPVRVRVRAGAEETEAWVRAGATGGVEIPVPADATAIEVVGDGDAEVHVAARLRVPHPVPVARAGSIRGAGADVDRLVEAVRVASRAARAGGPKARAARAARADALLALGFDRLAAFDRDDAAAAALVEEGAVAPVEALSLPAGSPAVAPLGVTSEIPALPLPADPGPLAAARAAFRAGDPRRAVELLRDPARASSGADALLLAVAAERVREPAVAARAFEAIGAAHASGAALARAASLAADAALAAADRAATARAYALAQRAADAGAVDTSAAARLAHAISWVTPARADGSAGSAIVDAPPRRATPTPLGARVRRALTDAPDHATLIDEEERLVLRASLPSATTYRVEGACHAFADDTGACALRVLVDGRAVRCDPGRGARGCEVEVPAGDHRVEVDAVTTDDPSDPRAVEVAAWASIRDAGGAVIAGRVASRFAEIDEGRPFRLVFAGPTVLRLRARADAMTARTLAWTVAPTGEGAAPVARAEWALPASRDEHGVRGGKRRDVEAPVGLEEERRVAVLDAGPHVLVVASPSGRALVRAEIATATGLPRPRAVARAAPAPAPAPPPAPAPAPPAPDAPVAVDPWEGPALFTARARYVDGDLVGEDTGSPDTSARTRFLEVALVAQRELAATRAWASLGALARVRSGPESFGGAASFDLLPDGFVPGLFVRGRVVAQALPGGPALGAWVAGGPQWSIRLLPSLALNPWIAGWLYRVDAAARGEPGADADVFTPYNESHARFGAVGLRLVGRPFVDTLVRLGLSARTKPTFDGVDRWDAQLDTDWLLGRGFAPWVNVSWLASVRPETEERKAAFVRNTVGARVTFWRWLLRGQRLSLEGDVRYLFDAPRLPAERPALQGGAHLAWDFAGGRGLRDLPPRSVVFRGRLEEGSGRVERREPRPDAGWELVR